MVLQFTNSYLGMESGGCPERKHAARPPFFQYGAPFEFHPNLS